MESLILMVKNYNKLKRYTPIILLILSFILILHLFINNFNIYINNNSSKSLYKTSLSPVTKGRDIFLLKHKITSEVWVNKSPNTSTPPNDNNKHRIWNFDSENYKPVPLKITIKKIWDTQLQRTDLNSSFFYFSDNWIGIKFRELNYNWEYGGWLDNTWYLHITRISPYKLTSIPTPTNPKWQLVEMRTLNFKSIISNNQEKKYIIHIDKQLNTRVDIQKDWITNLTDKCEVYSLQVDKNFNYLKKEVNMKCSSGKDFLWERSPFSKKDNIVFNDMINNSNGVWEKKQIYNPILQSNVIPSSYQSIFSRFIRRLIENDLARIDSPVPSLPSFKPSSKGNYNISFIRDYQNPCPKNPSEIGNNCGWIVNYFPRKIDNILFYDWENSLREAASLENKIPERDLKIETIENFKWRNYITNSQEELITGPLKEENHLIAFDKFNWQSQDSNNYEINYYIKDLDVADKNILLKLFYPQKRDKILSLPTNLTRRYNINWSQDIINSIPFDLSIKDTIIPSKYILVTNQIVKFKGEVNTNFLKWDPDKGFVFDLKSIYAYSQLDSHIKNSKLLSISPDVEINLKKKLFKNWKKFQNKPWNFKVTNAELIFNINNDFSISLIGVNSIIFKNSLPLPVLSPVSLWTGFKRAIFTYLPQFIPDIIKNIIVYTLTFIISFFGLLMLLIFFKIIKTLVYLIKQVV